MSGTIVTEIGMMAAYVVNVGKNSIRNDQQYALVCNIPLFHILATTCFANSLPLSGNFLDPSELLETTICTDCSTPLFYVLAPICFGSSLPSSGIFLDPLELPNFGIIAMTVNHIGDFIFWMNL
jgi:hypothetical protein